jgi:hypothetical protein
MTTLDGIDDSMTTEYNRPWKIKTIKKEVMLFVDKWRVLI